MSEPDPPRARAACVVAGATPAAVAALIAADAEVRALVRANRLGALVVPAPGGRLAGLPVDCAFAFAGPVYDVLYNPTTGWFAVTIFRGGAAPVRFDNRPGEACGYPRVDDVLGAAAPAAILEALDVPAAAIGLVHA